MAGAQAAWGIDVGITSLKAIKLRKDGDKVAVEAFEVIEHDKFLSEPDVDRDELIRHSVRKFLELNPVKGEGIFVGVPGSSTFARFVKLPPVDPKKIPEIVKFEAIQQIPFPLDQVNWDYQTFISPESPDVEVGIFAMKKELVGQVLANFRSTGLTVHGVQMSPLAVYNAASYDGLTDGKGTVLIDMGAEHTDLVIMDQGRLWLRTINIGGNHFTDALAKSFKQSFTRAESLKKTAATSKYQKQIFQAMRPIFADLVAEIQRSIGHYNSSHRDSKLERIVGMGNPFKLPNLQKYLQQELKMEVIRLDNFRKVVTDGKLAAGLNEAILSMTASYGLAVQGLGLATIDTNLLPVEIARDMMWRKKRPWFIAAAAMFVLVLVVWQAQYWTSYKAVNSAATNAEFLQNNSRIGEAGGKHDAWGKLDKNAYKNNKDSVDFYLNLADQRAIWPQISLDILAALPQAGKGGHGAADDQIVITSVTSEFSNKLSTGVALTPAPMGGGYPGGPDDPGNDPRPRPGPAPAPAPGPVVPGAAPLPGESDRGFLVTVTGYVASHKPTNPGHNVFYNYKQNLLKKAAKKGSKPYYFDNGSGDTGDELHVTSGTSTVSPIWGGQTKGPFWDVFTPDLTGIKPEEKLNATGGTDVSAMPPLPAVDLYATHVAGTPLKDMDGDFVFTMRLKVYIKEPAAATPGSGAVAVR